MNFNDILNTPVEDIKRPPLPPFGTYKFAVSKVPTIRDQKGKNGEEWDIIDFLLKAVAPGEDVDISALQEYGAVGNIMQTKTFMFDRGDKAKMETTLFNLKRFIQEHLNVDWPDGTPLKAALAKTVNATCMGNVQYEPDKNDSEVMWARLKSTTSAQ